MKARKILRHIYEELHPVVNTKTGKFVKFLPDGQSASQARSRGRKASTQGRGRKSTSCTRTRVPKIKAGESVAGSPRLGTRLTPSDASCVGSVSTGKPSSDLESSMNSEIS